MRVTEDDRIPAERVAIDTRVSSSEDRPQLEGQAQRLVGKKTSWMIGLLLFIRFGRVCTGHAGQNVKQKRSRPR